MKKLLLAMVLVLVAACAGKADPVEFPSVEDFDRPAKVDTPAVAPAPVLPRPEWVWFDPNLLSFIQPLTKVENETILCMFGQQVDHLMAVTKYRPPLTIHRTPIHVQAVECGEANYLGMLHTHVNGFCGFSDEDTKTFAEHPRSRIDAVACEQGVLFRLKGDSTVYGIRY